MLNALNAQQSDQVLNSSGGAGQLTSNRVVIDTSSADTVNGWNADIYGYSSGNGHKGDNGFAVDRYQRQDIRISGIRHNEATIR